MSVIPKIFKETTSVIPPPKKIYPQTVLPQNTSETVYTNLFLDCSLFSSLMNLASKTVRGPRGGKAHSYTVRND